MHPSIGSVVNERLTDTCQHKVFAVFVPRILVLSPTQPPFVWMWNSSTKPEMSSMMENVAGCLDLVRPIDQHIVFRTSEVFVMVSFLLMIFALSTE